MTVLLVLLLVGLWGAVFLPALTRAHRNTSPIASVGTFKRSMRALARGPSGRWVMVPQPKASQRKDFLKRRRQVLAGLLSASAVSLLIGVIPSARDVLWVHLVLDLVLAGYIAFLIKTKKEKAGGYVPRHAPAPIVLEEEPQYRLAEHF